MMSIRDLGRRGPSLVCLVAWFLLSFAAGVRAQGSNRLVDFDIPAQAMSTALIQFGKQAGLQVVSSGQDLGGISAATVKGRLTVREAIDRLIEGTGLVATFNGESTVVVRPSPEGIRKPENASSPQTREKVEVTGSRLTHAEAEGAQPIIVLSREQIERSGKSTVAEILNSVPQVSARVGETSLQTFGGQNTVRLRGFPLGTTLVLINGRRVQTDGAQSFLGAFFDLNLIPASIVERIEILAEGSSAIYGGSAIAGAVNIILKKSFEGAEATIGYGHASGTDETTASVAAGRKWDAGSISLAGSYLKRSDLMGTERSITADNDYRRFGGTDNRNTFCNPGTVYSADGSNLPGIGAPNAGIPSGTRGVPPTGAFVPGTPNRCSYYSIYDLLPSTERTGLFASGELYLNADLQAFGELAVTKEKQTALFFRPSFSRTLIPATNAFNPFGRDVRVDFTFGDDVPRQGTIFDTTFTRPLAGLRGNVFASWNWEIAAWQSKDTNTVDIPLGTVNSAALTSALASSDPNAAINVFGGSPTAPAAVINSIYSTQVRHYVGQSDNASGFVRGPLAHLPAGNLDVALGAEASHDQVHSEIPGSGPTGNYTFARHAYAGFVEARAPVLAGSAGTPGELLTISGASRYDHSDDFGGKTTSQVAIEVRPIRALLLRGGYADSYRAPNLLGVYLPASTFQGVTVRDTRNGGAATVVSQIFGGNPLLKSETANSQFVGAVWSATPSETMDSQATLTYWKTKIKDRIASFVVQSIVDNESLFPGRVVRGPTGTIVSVDNSFLNFGSIDASGLDLEYRMNLRTRLGEWTPGIDLAYVDKYRVAVTPNVAAVSRLGHADPDAWAPRLKGSLSLDWKGGATSFSGTGRYIARYLDFNNSTRYLGDYWTFDFNVRHYLTKSIPGMRSLAKDVYLALGVVNVFDRLPQYSSVLVNGYDATQADIRGRFVYANIGVRF